MTTTEYRHTHVSAHDGSPAMLVRLNGDTATMMNENGDIWTDPAAEWLPTELRHRRACTCARNTDGSVTTLLCSQHARVDPCLTMASVTGRRRKGTIRRGTCTACGHKS